MILEAHEKRLIEEHDQLGERIGKLYSFFYSNVWKTLEEEDQLLLREQYDSMNEYLSVLRRRVNRAFRKRFTPSPTR